MKSGQLTVNIIGAGRLGLQLAMAIKSQVKLSSITCRTPEKSKEAQRLTGAHLALTNLSDLPPADITFLTTPDDTFSTLVEILAQHPASEHAIMVHCSGLLTSDILHPLKAKGYAIGSIHPFRAFTPFQPHLAHPLLKGCHCFAEGDRAALIQVTKLFESCGAVIHWLDPDQKIKYHLAAVLASNHLITLAASAQEILISTGVSETESVNVICDIMQSALNNFHQAVDVEQALTGPIVRGDIQTLKKHIQVTPQFGITSLYRELSYKALELTPLSLTKKKMIRSLLDSTNED